METDIYFYVNFFVFILFKILRYSYKIIFGSEINSVCMCVFLCVWYIRWVWEIFYKIILNVFRWD